MSSEVADILVAVEGPRVAMKSNCPRCNFSNVPLARFCGQCGLWLPTGDAAQVAGRLTHPAPLAAPAGFTPVPGAADLFTTSESGFGGPPLLGSEGLRIHVFNAGYDLANVVFELRGVTRDVQTPISLLREVAELARGASAVLEVPSYELPDRVGGLTLGLLSAEFATSA